MSSTAWALIPDPSGLWPGLRRYQCVLDNIAGEYSPVWLPKIDELRGREALLEVEATIVGGGTIDLELRTPNAAHTTVGASGSTWFAAGSSGTYATGTNGGTVMFAPSGFRSHGARHVTIDRAFLLKGLYVRTTNVVAPVTSSTFTLDLFIYPDY